MFYFRNYYLQIRVYKQLRKTFEASTTHKYLDSISKLCDCLLSEEGKPTFPSVDREDIEKLERKVKGYKKGLNPLIRLQKQKKKDKIGGNNNGIYNGGAGGGGEEGRLTPHDFVREFTITQ